MQAKMVSWIGDTVELLTLRALLKLLSKVWSDDCGAVLNCARVSQHQLQQRNEYGEKRTFLGAVLVPLRSLPPEPVYVLWVGVLQV